MSEQLKKNDYVVFEDKGRIYQLTEDEKNGAIKLEGFGEMLWDARCFTRIDLEVIG